MIHHAGAGDETDLDLSGHEIDDHRRIAAIGHMDRLEAGVQAEILHHQMAGRSGAAAGIGDGLLPCGGGLRVGDELRHRIDRNGRVHDQHVAGRGDDRDQPEVLVRIEGQLLVEARIHGQRRAEHQPQRVSVGRSPGDDFGADIAARARPILDHERLLEADRQLVGDGPRDDVEWPAGRIRHDQLDQAVGIGLLGGGTDRPRAAPERHAGEENSGKMRGSFRDHACLRRCGSTVVHCPRLQRARFLL